MRWPVFILLLLAAIGLILLDRSSPRPDGNPALTAVTNGAPEFPPISGFRRGSTFFEPSAPGPAAGSGIGSNFFQRLSTGEIDLQLSAGQWAEYIRQYGTNVETLLATQRKEYLTLAAQLFPDDPRVQYAVISRDLFPEDRRAWLERFKKTDPENALARYLSASDYIRSGNRDEAVRDLTEATATSRFNDYTVEQIQNMEDAHISAGRSLVEAKFAASSELLLPQLAMFRELAQGIQGMQKEYIAAGDTASAESLAHMGHALARHLSSGEGSRTLIAQLVGVAIDRLVLDSLPVESHPEFLNGSVQQRLDELAAFRKDARSMASEFDHMLSRADEAEIIGYLDRLKLQGEQKALRWIQNRNTLRDGLPE